MLNFSESTTCHTPVITFGFDVDSPAITLGFDMCIATQSSIQLTMNTLGLDENTFESSIKKILGDCLKRRLSYAIKKDPRDRKIVINPQY